MSNAFTMLELVSAVASRAADDTEIVATVARLVAAGAVCLSGSFRGVGRDVFAALSGSDT